MKGYRLGKKASKNLGCATSTFGCMAALIGLSFLIGILYFSRVSSNPGSRDQIDGGGRIVLRDADLRSLSSANMDGDITAKHLIGLLCAPSTTKLARNQFIEKAQGSQVSLLLQLDQIEKVTSPEESDTPARIKATFVLPYEINSKKGRSSQLRIQTDFLMAQSNELLEYRVGDWIEVSGKLHLSNSEMVVLIEPSITPGDTK